MSSSKSGPNVGRFGGMACNDFESDMFYRRVYRELWSLAHGLMRCQPRDILQTTSLVNEVVVRFERSGGTQQFPDNAVFLAVAAIAMKQILIDHHRRRARRVEAARREPLDDAIDRIEYDTGCDVESLYRELDRLQKVSPRQHAVVMHRFFGGLTISETAEVLCVSTSTVERDWRIARAKLLHRLQKDA